MSKLKIDTTWILDSADEIYQSVLELDNNGVTIPPDITGMLLSISTRLEIMKSKSRIAIKKGFING